MFMFHSYICNLHLLMNIFLVNPSDQPYILLSEEESAHCIRVLRHRNGDEIQMVDGAGTFYKGKITVADAKLKRGTAQAERGELLDGDKVFDELRELIEERRRAKRKAARP